MKNELATTRERIGEFRARRADGILNGVAYSLLDAIDVDLRRAGIDRQRLKIARDLLRSMILNSAVELGISA